MTKSHETAVRHQEADKACGREWECACSACHILRKKMVRKDPSLKKAIQEVEKTR